MTTNKKKVSNFEIILFKFFGIVFMLLAISMYILPMSGIKIHKDFTQEHWYLPFLLFIFGMLVYLYYKEVSKAGLEASKITLKITKAKIENIIEDTKIETEETKEEETKEENT